MKISKTNKHILLSLVIIHLLFFIIKVFFGNFFLQDSYEYYSLAENIKNSLTFYSSDLTQQINLDDFTKRPPLYGFFILIFSFFLKSDIIILITQNILSILSILMTISLFSNYFNKLNSNLFLVLMFASISQFIYTNYIMSEILLQFLIIVLCYIFHNMITKKSLFQALFFQIVIILLFLTKPVFYLFVIPNIFICIWLSKYVRKAYYFSLIPIAALLIYMSWNEQRTGSFEFSSIQNLALKNYNLRYFNINKYSEEYAIKINEEINNEANKANSYKEKQHIIKTLSLKYLKKDWLSYSWFHIKGSLRMFLDPGRFDLYMFFNFHKNHEVGFLAHINRGGIIGVLNYYKQQPMLIIILLPLIFLFNLIKLYGFVIYFIKDYKATKPILWFALFLILYIIILTGPGGASRFLVPVLPLYCMFASKGLLENKYFTLPNLFRVGFLERKK
jgi:hypothetical protein